MRIHQESGYRLCFVRRGKAVILLPFVGGKGSQEQYIHVAQRLAKEIDDENYEV
ncbi:MAG: addiction module killer protein [Boseongicola sp. SB0670_bin_30]|nr:addiction module killer protein [Boseongicola sp. SB0670_bin_30]